MLYIGSYSLKYFTMIIVAKELVNIESLDFWRDLQYLNASDLNAQVKTYETFYWLNSGMLVKILISLFNLLKINYFLKIDITGIHLIRLIYLKLYLQSLM